VRVTQIRPNNKENADRESEEREKRARERGNNKITSKSNNKKAVKTRYG
jgi:hypothetical protein